MENFIEKTKELFIEKKGIMAVVITLDIITFLCSIKILLSSFFAVIMVKRFLRNQENNKSNKLLIFTAYFLVIINGPFFIALTALNYYISIQLKDKTSDLQERKEETETSFERWISFEKSLINKQIIEADSNGCDFLEISESGNVEGFVNGNLQPLYTDSIPEIPHEYIQKVCDWIYNQWKEISTDYSDDKVILSWR